jgi:ribonucleoside-diphosphate reductase alpha chain
MADSDYRWLTEASKRFLHSGNAYIEEGMSVDDRVTIIAETAEKYLSEYDTHHTVKNYFKRDLIKNGFAKKFKDYMKRGWFSLSTPIWTNFGNDKGLPISCFNSYIEDDSESICYTQAEISIMSKYGGGTSAYFGKLRERGSGIKGGRNGTSGGPIPFIETFDKNISVWSQGSTRRGSFAAYLDIDHPDIMEFLAFRSPGNPIKDISFAICVSDDWLNKMVAGDSAKREIWARVLEVRNNTGYPYIFFTDTVNRGRPQVYKDKGLWVYSSNLCIETTPPSNADESFVCDLS